MSNVKQANPIVINGKHQKIGAVAKTLKVFGKYAPAVLMAASVALAGCEEVSTTVKGYKHGVKIPISYYREHTSRWMWIRDPNRNPDFEIQDNHNEGVRIGIESVKNRDIDSATVVTRAGTIFRTECASRTITKPDVKQP